MSKGVIKYSAAPNLYDGPYEKKGLIDADEFFTNPGFAARKKQLFVGAFEMPEGSLLSIDAIIGKFLQQIQEAAFIPADDVMRAVYRGTPGSMIFGDEFTDEEDSQREDTLNHFPYFTTLSPELLASTIRHSLQGLLTSIFHAGGKSGILTKVLREKDPDEPESLPDKITKFTPEILLSSAQTRRLLQAMNIELDGVNNMAIGFADMVMHRSALSLPSIRRDIFRILQQSLDSNAIIALSADLERSYAYKEIGLYDGIGVIREQSPEDRYPGRQTMYSTLHPEDLIKSVRAFLEHIEITIFLQCLDENAQKGFIKGLETYGEKTGSAA